MFVGSKCTRNLLQKMNFQIYSRILLHNVTNFALNEKLKLKKMVRNWSPRSLGKITVENKFLFLSENLWTKLSCCKV